MGKVRVRVRARMVSCMAWLIVFLSGVTVATTRPSIRAAPEPCNRVRVGVRVRVREP